MSGVKILVLGSGMVGGPCVAYLLRSPRNKLTIGQSAHLHLSASCMSLAREGRVEMRREQIGVVMVTSAAYHGRRLA